VTFALALILCPLALLTLCFGIELIVGVRPIGRRKVVSARNAGAVIVIPAHDEELIIGATLENLRHLAGNSVRILVVADNCADGTAKIATNMGVDVVERVDHARRGKGFALDFARQHLRANPPAVVVVIDADCTAALGSIERLVAACAKSGRPCQASYVQTPAADGPPALQLSTFAFYIKNVVRQRALQRLAGGVHLLGTGMAFPWGLFEQVALASANIVEDLEIGLQLASAGHPPLAVEEAIVSSDPAAPADTLEQRRRWEGGYLASAARWAPRMVMRSLRRGDFGGLWAALDLLIPPLALLVTLDVAALLIAALLHAFVGGALWPLLFLAATLVLAAIALAIAWAAGGSRYVTLGGLARIPLYLLWKLPLYVGLARKGSPREWVRTRRG
jgi:Glycosyltransferase like family 2